MKTAEVVRQVSRISLLHVFIRRMLKFENILPNFVRRRTGGIIDFQTTSL